MKTYERRLRLIDQHMAIARAIASMPVTPRRRIEWGMTAAEFAVRLRAIVRAGTLSMKDFR